MLNTFPDLLAFSLLAPFLIRVSLGILFIIFGYYELKKRSGILTSSVTYLKIIGGLMLIVGLLTQISSLVLAIITFINIIIGFRNKSYSKDKIFLFIFIFIATISLLLSGAGIFAIDLPL